ncbi:5'(3')-deoxyribonucleotidase [Clostridiales Family XIII bacterium PM5-7]
MNKNDYKYIRYFMEEKEVSPMDFQIHFALDNLYAGMPDELAEKGCDIIKKACLTSEFDLDEILAAIYDDKDGFIRAVNGTLDGYNFLKVVIGEKTFDSFSRNEKRLFVDMDGTLAEFHPVEMIETLYERGYFRNLPPERNVVDGVKIFIDDHPDVEVYILSSVLADSEYALEEKNEWLDEYLPEIKKENRIFVECGEDKRSGVPLGVFQTDLLIDDYTKNLDDWSENGKGLKILNGINDTNGSWKGARMANFKDSQEIAADIYENLISGNEQVLQHGQTKLKQEEIEL